MRVLHLGAGNLYGGIETLLVALARERAGCPEMTPEFGVCFEGRLSSELRSAGVTVHVLGKVRFSRPWSVWLARKRLRSLLAQNPPDAVVTHACWPHALFAPVVRAASIPLIFWAHDVAHMEHWLDRKASHTIPKRVIANSRWTAGGIAALFPGIPVEVVHPPVRPTAGDSGRRDSLRREMATPADSVVILMACRLEEWKGHRLLLEALQLLKDDTRWTCWIAGGAQRPSEEEYLRQLHELETRLGLTARMRWLGQRSDVPDLLAASDIYCQPNLGPEPFGIAVVEALYAGKPVLSARLGGVAEIVCDSCGILVDSSSAERFAAALARLIDRPDLRAEMGAEGPARALSLCGADKQLRKLRTELEWTQRAGAV